MGILLNCDLGQGEAAETAVALLAVVDLANIACGGEAGDGNPLRRVVREALARGVQAGAHAGWPEGGDSGPPPPPIGPRALAQMMSGQIGDFRRVLREAGGALGHVKLQGPLYQLCDGCPDLAEACVDWMESELEGVPLIVGAGGLLHAVAEARGVPLLREISADRGYADEAELLPRDAPGARIDDPEAARLRFGEWKATGCLDVGGGKKWLVEAETVCVHADLPRSVEIARAVREVLEKAEG